MNFAIGVPKDLRIVLQECGVDTTNMNADQMREVLKQHPDFSDKKCQTERLLVEKHNYLAYFLHKYHCELNLPPERQSTIPITAQMLSLDECQFEGFTQAEINHICEK